MAFGEKLSPRLTTICCTQKAFSAKNPEIAVSISFFMGKKLSVQKSGSKNNA
jgi:hypothetical protein